MNKVLPLTREALGGTTRRLLFGCKREQIVNCNWDETCKRFPCTGITIPDSGALTSLSEVLTGNKMFSARTIPLSTETFYELSDSLHVAVRDASVDDLIVQLDIMDAKGANLVTAANAGPMFFARLPAGTYRISAAAEGKTFKRTVKVGTAPKEIVLHWENDSPDDPGPQE